MCEKHLFHIYSVIACRSKKVLSQESSDWQQYFSKLRDTVLKDGTNENFISGRLILSAKISPGYLTIHYKLQNY
jgi:hypothetical protein